jgi:hypothetical protein
VAVDYQRGLEVGLEGAGGGLPAGRGCPDSWRWRLATKESAAKSVAVGPGAGGGERVAASKTSKTSISAKDHLRGAQSRQYLSARARY